MTRNDEIQTQGLPESLNSLSSAKDLLANIQSILTLNAPSGQYALKMVELHNLTK